MMDKSVNLPTAGVRRARPYNLRIMFHLWRHAKPPDVTTRRPVLSGLRGFAEVRRLPVILMMCGLMPIAGCKLYEGPPSRAVAQRSAWRADRPKPTRPTPPAIPSDPDAPAPELSVNGEIIRAETVLRPYMKELTEKAATVSPAAYQQLVAQYTVRATRDRVSDVLLYQWASARLTEQDHKALDKIVDAEMRKLVTQKANGVQRVYEQMLKEEGLTLAEDRERQRRQLIVQRQIHLSILPKIQAPTRDELLEIFEQARAEMTRPERRRLWLIEVDILRRLPPAVTQPTREQWAQARAAAMDAIQAAQGELAAGAAFEDVARKYSEGLHADNGGDWGWIARDTLREKWQKAVDMLFALPDGGISDVVETTDRLFIVRCGGIEPGVQPTFQDAQPELIQRYRLRQADRIIGDMLQNLHDKARFKPERIEPFLKAVAATAPPYSATAGP